MPLVETRWPWKEHGTQKNTVGRVRPEDMKWLMDTWQILEVYLGVFQGVSSG